MGGRSAARSIDARRQGDDQANVDEAALDLVDVPAAVVCANCGDPDCPGCLEDELTQGSGVIAIIPWERPGLRLRQRLISTARLATTSSESFFGALPDGDIAGPLAFAILCELLAVTGLTLALVPIVLLSAPWLFHALLVDAALREMALRAVLSGIPGVAFAMVGIHAAHGLGLDIGARRQGARPRSGRGLRFGLYACGWDLFTLPLGLLLVAIFEGPRRALSNAALGLTVPGRAARAYLRGVHQLGEAETRAASRLGILLAGSLIAVATLAISAATLLR